MPAIYYDPVEDNFGELGGSGMALGVKKDSLYEERRRKDFSPGSVIVLATDGVWETRDESGEMLGRSAVYDIIRNNYAGGAEQILNAAMDRIKGFRKTKEAEDDVTLVVIKLQ